MSLTDVQKAEHTELMKCICQTFHKKNLPMVLKGGTALKLCYGLTRFSEDLDFDSIKILNLETSIKEAFTHLGKSRPHLRHPEISITKDTQTVRRYRIIYDNARQLKLETSFRNIPHDDDVVEINGILTYKINYLITQKLGALKGRTAARDLHDVIYLYEKYFDQFDADSLDDIKDLYTYQADILDEYNPAYSEDNVLSTSDLLRDYSKFIDLYESRAAIKYPI